MHLALGCGWDVSRWFGTHAGSMWFTWSHLPTMPLGFRCEQLGVKCQTESKDQKRFVLPLCMLWLNHCILISFNSRIPNTQIYPNQSINSFEIINYLWCVQYIYVWDANIIRTEPNRQPGGGLGLLAQFARLISNGARPWVLKGESATRTLLGSETCHRCISSSSIFGIENFCGTCSIFRILPNIFKR